MILVRIKMKQNKQCMSNWIKFNKKFWILQSRYLNTSESDFSNKLGNNTDQWLYGYGRQRWNMFKSSLKVCLIAMHIAHLSYNSNSIWDYTVRRCLSKKSQNHICQISWGFKIRGKNVTDLSRNIKPHKSLFHTKIMLSIW